MQLEAKSCGQHHYHTYIRCGMKLEGHEMGMRTCGHGTVGMGHSGQTATNTIQQEVMG